MGRKRQSYRVGGPVKDATRHKAPYWCKWYELVTDKSGCREVAKSQWFATLKEAEAHGKRVTGNRADVRDFTDQERIMVVHFFSECNCRQLDPLDVFTAGLRHFGKSPIKSITIDEAFDHYQTWMVGKRYRPATQGNHKVCINRLIRQTDGQRLMDSFSATEIITAIKMHYDHPVSQGNYLKALRAFFNWGFRENYNGDIAKGMTLSTGEKDSMEVSAEKKSNERPPRLTASEVKACFNAVPEHYHPALALAVFAGFRPKSELPNIEWSHTANGNFYGIDFDQKRISIPTYWNTKMRKARTLHDLPDPLWKILERHRKLEGRVSPVNYTNWRKSVISPIKKALNIDHFPNDILRHTSLSFMYVLSGHETTMNNAGHSKKSDVFRECYNNAVGRAEAEEFQGLEI